MTLELVQAWMDAGAAAYALRLACGISAVWMAAAIVALLLRKSSAALRHRVWALSMAAVLALPALVAVLPEWRVGTINLAAGPAIVEMPAEEPVPAAVAPPVVQHEAPAGRAMRFEPPSMEMPHAAAMPAREEVAIPLAAMPPEVTPATPEPAPAAEVVEPAEARPARWGLWFCVAWLIPAFWLAAWQVAALWAARNLVQRAMLVDGGSSAEALSRLVGRLGIGIRPRLLESAEVGSPVCLGWWRPAIVLPEDWRDWPAGQLEAVLTHELAHVARRDVLWQTLARLACAIYWVHPLAWVAVWRLRVERELACDDWVLRGGESSTRYARWLLEAATRLLGREPHAAERVGVAMAARSGFEKRIRAILDPHRRRFPVSRPMAAVLTLAAAGLLGLAGMLSPLAADKADAGEVRNVAETVANAADAVAPQATPAPKLVRIAGRVEDEEGQPVADALVECGRHPPPYSRSTRTDSDGRYVLDIEPRNYFAMHASTPDRQAYHLYRDEVEAGKTYEVRLVVRPLRQFSVTVNDVNGQPVPGASVAVTCDYRVMDEATADAAGRAVLRIPADAAPTFIMASKADVGLDYLLFWKKGEIRADLYRLEPDHRDPITLVLNGATTVKVRVVDGEARPLAGANVNLFSVQKPRKGDSARVNIRATTDERGIAEFRTVPADNTAPIRFDRYLEGYSAPNQCVWDPKSGQMEITTQLLRQVPVTGRIIDPTGRPVGGATVNVTGASEQPERERFSGRTESADDGTFRIDVDANLLYLFVAQKDHVMSPLHSQVIGFEAPAPMELTVHPGTRLRGRVVVGPDRTPMPGARVGMSQTGPSFGAGSFRRSSVSHGSLKADEQGAFEWYILPGDYRLGWDRLTVGLTLSADGACRAFLYNVPQWTEYPVDVSPDGIEITLHVADAPGRPATFPLKGRVVLRDKPDVGVANAVLSGQIFEQDRGFPITGASDQQGNFTVPRHKSAFYLHAATPDGREQGMVWVKAEADEVVIPVGPTASVSGRVLDADGSPLANRRVSAGAMMSDSRSISWRPYGGNASTGEEGLFAIDGLVPGIQYEMYVALNAGGDGRVHVVRPIKPERAERIALGDVKLPPSRRPMTVEEHAVEAFTHRPTIVQRLTEARQSARRSTQHILVVLGGPMRPASLRFFQLWRDEQQRDLWEALGSYAVVAVNIDAPDAGAIAWAERMKVRWPAGGMTLAVLDADGRLLAQTTDEALSADGTLDRQRLLGFIKQHAPARPDAVQLMEAALARAKREGKNILLEVGGPYCGPCKLLGAYIEANRALLEKDFVHVKIDQDFLNHGQVVSPLRVKSFSIPWMAILSPDGRMIINSDGPSGNIGYFGGEEGQAHWEKMLRAGAKRLTEAEIRRLVENTRVPLSTTGTPEPAAANPAAAAPAATPAAGGAEQKPASAADPSVSASRSPASASPR